MNCGQCIYVVKTSAQCSKLGITVDLQKDTCPLGSSTVYVCARCSHITDDPIFDAYTGGKVICGNCLAELRTCASCVSSAYCDFESNASSLPKAVVQNIRQGNMVIQTQVRNPERVKITCANGCKCFHEGECMRQHNYCDSRIEKGF